MAEPYDVSCVGLLPVWDAEQGRAARAPGAPSSTSSASHVSTRETVEDVQRDTRGWFDVKTNKQVYSAQRVVLAIGTRGKPRKLGVPGEHLAKVTALLDRPGRCIAASACSWSAAATRPSRRRSRSPRPRSA